MTDATLKDYIEAALGWSLIFISAYGLWMVLP
jgi:hypothetical protein